MGIYTLQKHKSTVSCVHGCRADSRGQSHTQDWDRRHEKVPLGDVTLCASRSAAKVCILRRLLCEREQCPWAPRAWCIAGSHIQREKHAATGAMALSRDTRWNWHREDRLAGLAHGLRGGTPRFVPGAGDRSCNTQGFGWLAISRSVRMN